MPKQGEIDLLSDPIAQDLLHSRIPARLAYVWPDGTPRVVPVLVPLDRSRIRDWHSPESSQAKGAETESKGCSYDR